MFDFTKSIEAGKVAAKSTRDLATSLSVASATGKWSAEHTQMAIGALFLAAGYIDQAMGVVEAINGQLKEMFPPVPPAPVDYTADAFLSKGRKKR